MLRIMIEKLRAVLSVTSLPVLIASLCCLSPLILVTFGIGTVSYASSLANTLYGEYRWAFRLVGLGALALALLFYFRRQRGICTIDEAKRRKNEIINMVALTVIFATLAYIVFLYVIVHYAGVWAKIWE